MKLTRNELIDFIFSSISEDDMEIAEQLAEEADVRWFQNSEVIEMTISEFYDWVCAIADELEANNFFICDKCGLTITENDGEIITTKEKSEGKIVNINPKTKKFELVPTIKEVIWCVCPCCGHKIYRKQKILNTL